MKKLLPVLIVFSGNTYAGLFGPDNYEDCVLEGIKDAKTDLAVKLVINTCLDKFPPETKVNPKPTQTIETKKKFVCEVRGANYRPWEIELDASNKVLIINSKTRMRITHVSGTKYWTESASSDAGAEFFIFDSSPYILSLEMVVPEVSGKQGGDRVSFKCAYSE